jgi:hypothetical protein
VIGATAYRDSHRDSQRGKLTCGSSHEASLIGTTWTPQFALAGVLVDRDEQ